MKYHIANSPESLVEGSSIPAICEATVQQAHFVSLVINGNPDVQISVIGLCAKCRKRGTTWEGIQEEGGNFYLDFRKLEHRLVYVIEEGKAAYPTRSV